MKKYLFISLTWVCSHLQAQTIPPYKNPNLSPDVRAGDLVMRMTPEEKFWQLFMCPGDTALLLDTLAQHGLFGLQVSASSQGGDGQMLNYNTTDDAWALARKINTLQQYFVEKTRLGIPAIMFDEALHGLVRAGSTAFPQAIGLAATFDTALIHRVASDIADEVKARGIRQILSPVVNIAGDQRWGRVEESYGEDPVLTSAMGIAFISAFEKKNIITTPKHFIANVGDGGRDSYPIYYSERLLDEIYFPPFKAVIKEAGARSLMTAYNSLNGIPSSSNYWLLQQKLKNEWGFKGFVISDANAVGGDVVLHHTAKDYADAGAKAIGNGLDVIFQTDINHYRLFIPAFLDGRIDTARINDAVFRVLRAKFELGLFEHPYVDITSVGRLNNSTAHKRTALQAALESVVLLKNVHNTLPLKKNICSIAVIGEDAIAARLGGYSGPGNGVVNILGGIGARAGRDIIVDYAEGAAVLQKDFEVVATEYLTSLKGTHGLTGTYYNNITFSGQPAVERTDEVVDFLWTLSLPDEKIRTNFYSVRWSGKINSPRTGNFKIGLEGNDGYRLYLDNKLIADRRDKQSYHTTVADYYFEKDKQYDIRIEFYEPVGNARIKLVWNVNIANDWEQKIQHAVRIAKQSDVAVIVAGIHEGEFQDRGILSLPGHQEALINAVAETGKPVVVLLVGGSAITMNNWLDKVDAVADIWYPGEEGGNAVAQILFGDYNPAGRLPVTFPVSEGQLPLVYNHAPTGRGDDYYNLTGLPLFPFGYGLSYTTFSYKNLEFGKDTISNKEAVWVQCTITNSGGLDGDEVVQLYVHQQLASVARPVMQLKGFQRVHLKAGESKKVSFLIKPEMLSMPDKHLVPVVEPGNFDIMLGASSRDIRLRGVLNVE